MDKKYFKDKLTELVELEEPDTEASLTIEVKKLKPRIADCQLGCGQKVRNQVIERQRMAYPEPHWRIKCRTCQQCIHPSGIGFCKQNTFQAEINKIYRLKDK